MLFLEPKDGRVLSFDSAAAREFGVIAGLRKKAGLAIKVFDTQIAAIARANNALVLTANLRDFGQVTGLRAENWLAPVEAPSPEAEVPPTQ